MAAAEAGGAGDQLQGQAGDQGARQVHFKRITYQFKGIVSKNSQGHVSATFFGAIKN